jgi:DNA-directed RNA polymerase specialized sigma24 family protein
MSNAADSGFPSTEIDFSTILEASEGKMERLLKRYMPPMVRAIRAGWCGPKTFLFNGHFPVGYEAEDLVQEFFLWLLERPELLKQYDRTKRFRGFLRGMLVNFWSNRVQYWSAGKRGGQLEHTHLLQEAESQSLSINKNLCLDEPADLLDLEFIREVLDTARGILGAGYAAKGKVVLFESLWEKLLGVNDESGTDIANRLGLSKDDVDNAMAKLKKHSMICLQQVVAQFSGSKEDLQANLKLMKVEEIFRKSRGLPTRGLGIRGANENRPPA